MEDILGQTLAQRAAKEEERKWLDLSDRLYRYEMIKSISGCPSFKCLSTSEIVIIPPSFRDAILESIEDGWENGYCSRACREENVNVSYLTRTDLEKNDD